MEIGAVPTTIHEKKIKVGAEMEIPEAEHRAKDKINALRTKYHELLMAKMREERIGFSDRFDAANKAFDLVREEEAKYGEKQGS